MSILYDFYASPTTEKNEEDTPKYHVRAVNRQTLDPDTLINHICERSTLGKGEIAALLEELSYEIGQQLLAGNCVYIPKIGSFSLSLKSPADVNPTSTRAEQINVKRIEYRADSELRANVLSKATFERSPQKKHSAKLTNEEINNQVRIYLKDHPFLTRPLLEEICHLTKSTALNHIHRLIKEGILTNTNTSRQPIYILKDK